MSAGPPTAPAARIPSLGRRAVLGVLLLVPLLVLWVGIPYAVLTTLHGFGVSSGLDLVTVTVVGAVIAVLGAARYVLKPTRAFGPVAVLTSVTAVVYLLALSPYASFAVSIGKTATLSITYGAILSLLAIVPGIRAVSALVTTVEDGLHPGERLPYDFPA
jgi:hypothetical protein